MRNQDSLFIRYGNFLFCHRNTLFLVILLLLLGGFKPIAPAGSSRLDLYSDIAGLLVAALGQAIRAIVIGYAYIKRGGLNKKVYADALVTEGIFSHVRNPLYVGNLLILLGIFIIHNNPWVYVLGLAYFLSAYAAIVAAEEDFLRCKFGQAYEDYCRDTGRWLPRLKGWRDTLGHMSFNWRRVILKDYSSAYTWILGSLILIAYGRVRDLGEQLARPALETLAMVGILLTLVFIGIRYLKKRRILRENPS